MKTDYEPAQIIEDSNKEEKFDKTKVDEPKVEKQINKTQTKKEKTKKEKQTKIKIKKEKNNNILKCCYDESENVFEIGVDESGRGPLFGRVYTASVILPKDDSFDFSKVKDSKKFHSKKKIAEVSEYIKSHALSWHISYEDETKIDEINILQATQSAMHKSILEVRQKYNQHLFEKGKIERTDYSYSLLIDGNYFNPVTIFNKETNQIEMIPHTTIEGGDNKYASIAAASILAKVERDNYIHELCKENHELVDLYGIDTNKGYGTKKHIDGIKEYGITIWHRKTFAPCFQNHKL